MAIPPFELETGYLPPGLHPATMEEIRQLLGFTRRRLELIGNLEWATTMLLEAGVRDIRIDGSFATEKPEPGDIDGFWVYDPALAIRWDAIPLVLLDFTLVPSPSGGESKFPMWHALGVELWVHPWHGGTETKDLPYFFSHSRDDVPRGYVQLVPEPGRSGT